jgi:hypothetical protein
MDAIGHVRLLTDGTEVQWESYGTNCYITCPHCAARNIAIRRNNPGALPDLDIVAATIEDD